MARKYRKYDEGYKRSAIALAAKVSVHVAAAQLSLAESQIYDWRRKLGGENPAPVSKSTKSRTYWSDEDINAVAFEWVLLRAIDPIETPTILAERAQRKVFAGRGELQRDIASVKAIAPLMRAIGKLWKELIDKAHAPAPEPTAPPPPPAPPEPQIITVEVPRKLTADEMLAAIDEPTLEALLAAKRIARQSQLQETIHALAVQAGARLAPAKPFAPRFEVFHEGTTKTKRVAVVGLPESEHATLADEVQAAHLQVALRFPDGKDKESVSRCDFAIICRDASKNGSDPQGDRAIGELGRNRVSLLSGHARPVIVQEIRNILSRQ